ncbi:unnamed protein product, partial [Mesorhabditis belari]|uniref:Uncharacterized protein n=1 Tax=Mesorhabditis belari TaxID=2138241 RepID=A0AAF3F7L2_9BILA
MLHENGIPIGSSIKGVEQAIKTQKEIENNDPSEQIAKAVFEKFRQQILPGLVANIISGRNPFRMPNTGGGMSGMRQMQQMPEEIRQKLIAQQRSQAEESTVELNNENEIRRSPRRNDEDEHDLEDLETRLRSSPRLAILLKNPSIHSLLSNRRLHDEPLGRSLSDRFVKNTNLLEDFGTRSALALGINEMMAEDEEESSENQIRRSPLKLHPEFVASLSGNPEIAEALARLNYKVDEVDGLLIPKRRLINPHPQPGFLVPRKIPTKPRKMIPILVGVPDIDNAISTEWGTIRRAPSEMDVKPMKEYKSRVIANLKNNPNRKRNSLSRAKGSLSSHSRQIHPRMLGANTLNLSNIDKQVVQTMEERPIPPLFWIPKGKHTRIRWTGAQEKEIPGLGTRLIFPSLDPTAPALNTAMSTQGRARDEWDTMFKIPNNWNPGDEVGFNVKQKSERFIGGTGNFDMPASHL